MTPSDPPTFAAVPLLLAFAGLVACWILAFRASRASPALACGRSEAQVCVGTVLVLDIPAVEPKNTRTRRGSLACASAPGHVSHAGRSGLSGAR